MNDDTDRGFWFGKNNDATSAGAMSLTTDGVMVVAESIRVGGGRTDTSGADSGYAADVVGNAIVKGKLSVAETNDAVKKTSAFDADFSDGNVKSFSVDGTFNCTVSNMGTGVVCTLILNNGDTLNTSTITVVAGDGGTVKSVGGTDSVTIPASGTGIVSMVRNKNDIIILNIYNSVT